MTDFVIKVEQALATMNAAERQGYSRGLSHAFGEAFDVLGEELGGGRSLSMVLERLSSSFDHALDAQVVRGVL